MFPYVAMLAVPGLFALTGARRAGVMLLLVALLYWLMIGFRFQVGMDWNNYLRIYERTQHLSTSDVFFDREPGRSQRLPKQHAHAGVVIYNEH